MKRTFFTLCLGTLLFLTTASTCSPDDNSSTSSQDPAPVINTVTQGNWRVTNFTEDDSDHTNYFTGYTFTFGPSNSVVATNGTNSYTGVWSVTDDHSSSDDDHPNSSLDFNLYFSSPNHFTELNEDWDILERTDNKVRLKHISGGDGSVDLLTFEKN